MGDKLETKQTEVGTSILAALFLSDRYVFPRLLGLLCSFCRWSRGCIGADSLDGLGSVVAAIDDVDDPPADVTAGWSNEDEPPSKPNRRAISTRNQQVQCDERQ